MMVIGSHCRQSLYGLTDRTNHRDEQYLVVEVESITDKSGTGNAVRCAMVIRLDINGQPVRGYLEQKQELKKGDPLDNESAVKAVRAYCRPPLEVILSRSSTLKQQFQQAGMDTSQKRQEQFEKYAGSQAIFMCPFPSCGLVADADLQAAMWIALKGYLNLHYSKDETWDKGTHRDKINFMLDFAKDQQIAPVGFSLRQ